MITFKSEFISLILSGKKTRTTRFRKYPGVKVDGIYKAKTNRFSKEHFALIKVVRIQTADYCAASRFRRDAWISDLSLTIGYENHQRHAEKEGLDDWYHFRDVYTTLNAHHADDSRRKHYIIDFGVVNDVGEFIKTKFQPGDWVSWERYGKQKTAQVLEVCYSDWNQDWCYKLNSFVNDVPDFWDYEMEGNLISAVNPNID